MKRLQKRSILRIVTSLCAVFFLPILILYLIYAGQIMTAVKDEVYTIAKNDLVYSIRIIDSQVKALDNIAYVFQRGTGYQTYLSNRFSFNEQGVATNSILESDIAYIYQTNTILDDFFVVFPEVDTVFSISGMQRTNNYLEKYYGANEEMVTAFFNDISHISSNIVVTETPFQSRRGEGDHLYFIYPLAKTAGDNGGTAILCVPISTLSIYFQSHANDYQTIAFVYDDDSLLFSNNDSNHFVDTIAELKSSGHILEDGLEIEIDSQKYVVIQQKSEYTGWSYIELLPIKNSLYQNIFNISQIFRIYIIISIAIGLFAIAVFSWINYRPIMKLHKTVTVSEDSPGKGKAFTDDLEAISYAFTSLQNQKSALEATVQASIADIRAVRLNRLLSNYYSSLEDFNEDCEQIGLSFEFDNFFISIFLFEKALTDPYEVMNLILQEISPSGNTEGLYIPSQNQIVFVHSIAPNSSIIHEAFYSALGALHDQMGCSATIGIGHIKNTAEISKAYTQAMAALDSRFIRGTGIVITFDSAMDDYIDSKPYPRKLLYCLDNALSVGNYEETKEAVDTILNHTKESHVSLQMARCICFDVIKILFGYIEKTPVANYMFLDAFGQLNQLRSKTSMVELVMSVAEKITFQSSTTYSEDEDKLLQDILVFISENYLRCDFSIQEVSSRFEMLPVTIGNYFKVRMGCTLLDYLINQRMIKAKELLKTTDLPVKDISIQTGYYNVSSFIRRFKLHEGITPNEYRFKAN